MKKGMATDLLEFLYTNDELDVESIRNWPLFMEFRKTQYYTEFRNKNKEGFEVSALEIDENSSAYPE